MDKTSEELSEQAKAFLDKWDEPEVVDVTPKVVKTEEVVVKAATKPVKSPEVPQIIAESPNKLVLWEKLKRASESECEAVYAYLGLGPNPDKGEIWKAYIKL